MLSLLKLKETIDKMLEEAKKLKENRYNTKFLIDLGYKSRKFENNTGGIPHYNNLELTVVDREEKFMYSTSQNGDAKYGFITILCKKLNLVDDEGREIYLDYSGEFFVETFFEGNPSRFDYLELEKCNLLDINYVKEVIKNYDKK